MKNSLLFFAIPLAFLTDFANSAIISTSLGQIDGFQVGEFHLFKNIPFAKPPLGKLRFQKPERAEKWKGVRDAKEYGPACMSNSTITSSPQKWIDEDCLQLNVFTSNKCLKSQDCGVVFYIHGGALNYDSAVMFNDTYLLGTFVNQDVILVIPAFRLGIFSHFVVEDQSIAPNNLALYDILLSLEFVKADIHNFGGSNRKVTIMGHSYGGAITSMLSFSTKINTDLSLFQRAISMSSAHDANTLADQVNRTLTFARRAKCLLPKPIARKMSQGQQDKYMMKCLQNIDSFELLRIQRSLEEEGYPDLKALIIREPLFQEGPYSKFMDYPKKIPMLTGCTRYEMDHSPDFKPIAEALPFANPKEVEMKYRKDWREGNYDFGNHSDETQAIFIQTRERVNKLLSKGIATYLYEYTYPKHARHTDDLFYIMGVHRFDKDENEKQLARVYEKIFMNFAKFGEPGEGFELASIENSTYFEVYWNETSGERPHMKAHFEQNIIDYWYKDMVEYDRNVTAAKNSLLKKQASPRVYKESIEYQYPYMYFSVLMISLIFLSGCIVGRCCCAKEPSERNLYIRLDGNDHAYHAVKDF
ncbi:unnamed protein product [Caenorhabditis sp. 36 PRJEB53466]|nr:unnamed protein product [Caenorhabditis sp. 36 PRJEB53466]